MDCYWKVSFSSKLKFLLSAYFNQIPLKNAKSSDSVNFNAKHVISSLGAVTRHLRQELNGKFLDFKL